MSYIVHWHSKLCPQMGTNTPTPVTISHLSDTSMQKMWKFYPQTQFGHKRAKNDPIKMKNQ